LPKINETKFLEILEKAKTRLLRDRCLKSIDSGVSFQKSLLIILKEICDTQSISVHETGPQTFPDLLLDSFGIKAKIAASDNWVSTGDSILETTREDNLEKI